MQIREIDPQNQTDLTSFLEVHHNARKSFVELTAQQEFATPMLLNSLHATGGKFWQVSSEDGSQARIGAFPLEADPSLGGVGFFAWHGGRECAKKALDLAEDHLRSLGKLKAVGPIHGNTWFAYRYRTDQEPQSRSWEPANPRSYPELWRAQGYVTDKTYHSFCSSGLAALLGQTASAYQKACSKGYQIRRFTSGDLETGALVSLHRITHASFTDNYLFSALPFEDFCQLYTPALKHYQPLYGYLVAAPLAEESEISLGLSHDIAYLFAFLDDEALVFKSAAVDPRHQSHGLLNAMLHRALRDFHDENPTLDRYVTANVIAGNHSESPAKKNTLAWQHTYELFMKCLGP